MPPGAHDNWAEFTSSSSMRTLHFTRILSLTRLRDSSSPHCSRTSRLLSDLPAKLGAGCCSQHPPRGHPPFNYRGPGPLWTPSHLTSRPRTVNRFSLEIIVRFSKAAGKDQIGFCISASARVKGSTPTFVYCCLRCSRIPSYPCHSYGQKVVIAAGRNTAETNGGLIATWVSSHPSVMDRLNQVLTFLCILPDLPLRTNQPQRPAEVVLTFHLLHLRLAAVGPKVWGRVNSNFLVLAA